MTRDDNRQLVERMAPAAPPCFTHRGQWIEWLQAAEEAHRGPRSNTKPLIFKAGDPVRFNGELHFCVDCDKRHRETMGRAGRCMPTWLLGREAAAA